MNAAGLRVDGGKCVFAVFGIGCCCRCWKGATVGDGYDKCGACECKVGWYAELYGANCVLCDAAGKKAVVKGVRVGVVLIICHVVQSAAGGTCCMVR